MVSRDIKWMNQTSIEFHQPDDQSEDESISTLEIRENYSHNIMASIARDSISREMHEAMKEANEDADSEALLHIYKKIIKTVAEKESCDSDTSFMSVNHGQGKSKAPPKMTRELKDLGVENVYLCTMDRILCT